VKCGSQNKATQIWKPQRGRLVILSLATPRPSALASPRISSLFFLFSLLFSSLHLVSSSSLFPTQISSFFLFPLFLSRSRSRSLNSLNSPSISLSSAGVRFEIRANSPWAPSSDAHLRTTPCMISNFFLPSIYYWFYFRLLFFYFLFFSFKFKFPALFILHSILFLRIRIILCSVA
jgi:hypothetical protein